MAKRAETTKVKPTKEKRAEMEAKGVKKRTKTTSPTPQASTPTTKWDPETKKRVKQIVREEVKEEDRKKPKTLTAKTPEKGGAATPIGVDMFTTSLPTGMPAQSFSRSAAPKPFDVQVRPDGKLYVYSPVWNMRMIKLSSGGSAASEGAWNSVGTPGSSATLYAIQKETIDEDSGEVKETDYYFSFTTPGSNTSKVKYTTVKAARRFDGLGWRSLVSGALVTVDGTGGAAADTPLAWTVQKRGSGSGETWQVFSPAWVDGSTTKLPGTAKIGEWTSLGVSSGTVYAVYKETSSKPKEGESEEDVTWSFTSLTISDSVGVNTPPQAPSGGTGSATDGSAGIRFINVPIGKFENGDFTQYHEGIIVTGYSGGGGGSSGGGSSWGWGPLEWNKDKTAFVQYLGTFDESGENFTCCTTCMRTAICVIAHADDHTEGYL